MSAPQAAITGAEYRPASASRRLMARIFDLVLAGALMATAIRILLGRQTAHLIMSNLQLNGAWIAAALLWIPLEASLLSIWGCPGEVAASDRSPTHKWRPPALAGGAGSEFLRVHSRVGMHDSRGLFCRRIRWV
jgi:hypothetical protein